MTDSTPWRVSVASDLHLEIETMSRTRILATCLASFLVLIFQSPDVARGIQAGQESTAGIHETFKDRLKAAAKGQPTEVEAIEDALASAAKRQVEMFVETAMSATDEKTVATARKVRDSTDVVDCLVVLLSCELRSEEISDMESLSIRDSLEELDVRIEWDYSIATGAVSSEKTTVRIRLPKLHPCGGCKKRLEEALDATDGFENAVVDLSTLTAQFLANDELDIEALLNGLEEADIQQLDEWELVRK